MTRFKEEGCDATFVVRRDELDSGMTESSKAELKGVSGRPKAPEDEEALGEVAPRSLIPVARSQSSRGIIC